MDTGIYYHVAYWGSGPHLAIGNDPEKMLYNYDLAKSRNYAFNFLEQETPFPYYPINDDDIRDIGLFAMKGKEYKPGWLARFEKSAEDFEAQEQKVSQTRASAYFDEYKMMPRYIISLTR